MQNPGDPGVKFECCLLALLLVHVRGGTVMSCDDVMSCAEIERLVPCGVTLHIPRDSNDAVRDGDLRIVNRYCCSIGLPVVSYNV